MPMDGLTIGRIAAELHGALTGGRVDRIQQPENDEILLHIRNNAQNHRLLISASANHARAHLTVQPRQSPQQAPMFCMLLRKHLTNARVLSVEQPTADRVMVFTFETLDEFGEYAKRRIVVEIMGRHSNIILTNESGRILDSVKRVTADISRYREVLPGLMYLQPPAQDKLDTKRLTIEDCRALLDPTSALPLSRLLASGLSGLSQVAAREIAFRLDEADTPCAVMTDAQRAQAAEALLRFYAELPTYGPPVLLLGEDDRALDVFAFPYRSLEASLQHAYGSLSEAIDEFFRLRDRGERIAQRSSALRKSLTIHLERAVKKAAVLRDTLAQAERMDEHRIAADLILSNQYRIQRGDRVARVENFYEEGSPEVDIALDVQMTPAENAQRYYKKYAKAKASSVAAAEQLERTCADIDWFEAQLENIGKCVHMAELEEIRQEMVAEGVLRATARDKGKKPKTPASKPYRYRTSDGHTVYVGKNNAQNDRLTGKADGGDYWLHAKDMPGSHVILELGGQAPSDAALHEAAVLAAYYSKGRASQNVPVDYVERRYVKKPGGAKPGYVIFTHNRTAYVTPSEAAVRAIALIEE